MWQHGYELSKRTGVKAGTLYPLLIRLCEQGVLEATWGEADQAGRPPRHPKGGRRPIRTAGDTTSDTPVRTTARISTRCCGRPEATS